MLQFSSTLYLHLTLYLVFVCMPSPHDKGNSLKAAHPFHHLYIPSSCHLVDAQYLLNKWINCIYRFANFGSSLKFYSLAEIMQILFRDLYSYIKKKNILSDPFKITPLREILKYEDTKMASFWTYFQALLSQHFKHIFLDCWIRMKYCQRQYWISTVSQTVVLLGFLTITRSQFVK